jgi:hypothetical protein
MSCKPKTLYALVSVESGEILKNSVSNYRVYANENRAKSSFDRILKERRGRITKENTKLYKFVAQEEIEL